MASKVYFTNFRCEGNENLLQKFRRLCETAGVGSIDMKDKYVAVKMHLASRATSPSCATTMPARCAI